MSSSKQNSEEHLMTKIAWYYYFENMTQQEISKHLGITRMRVVKLLDKARQTGIIQFKIKPNPYNRLQKENSLIEKYNLKDVYVVPTNPKPEEANETIAKAAAMYVEDLITENCFINFGYGDTLSRTINHLATNIDTPVSFVSLTGGVSHYLPNVNSNFFNTKLYLVPAPLAASTKSMANAISSESSVQEIYNMTKLASITIVGIGSTSEDSTIINSGVINKNDLLLLKMQGAVGDILAQFIDQDGNLIDTELHSRLISTPISSLKDLNNVIGVACGDDKVLAIDAALKSSNLDILITDENTASQLINL